MCCAAGVSVQVGMNALLAKARPDRLLIEPTGIGHPKQIIRQLSQPPFDLILDMRACICLIDPRHLQDERYITNDYYNEQLEIADVLVANKTDQCDDTDKTAFTQLLETKQPVASGWVTQGQLDAAWLDLPHTSHASGSILQATIHADPGGEIDAICLEENEAYRRLENRSGEYASSGWLFADNIVFQQQKLITLFNAMDTERIKASLRTDQGNCIFNSVANDMTFTAMDATPDNRIEIIMQHDPDWDKIETALLSCIQ
jgi:G3E family GTPase